MTRKKARINCIKHILSHVEYPNKINQKELKTSEKILISGGAQELEVMEHENKFAKA